MGHWAANAGEAVLIGIRSSDIRQVAIGDAAIASKVLLTPLGGITMVGRNRQQNARMVLPEARHNNETPPYRFNRGRHQPNPQLPRRQGPCNDLTLAS